MCEERDLFLKLDSLELLLLLTKTVPNIVKRVGGKNDVSI